MLKENLSPAHPLFELAIKILGAVLAPVLGLLVQRQLGATPPLAKRRSGGRQKNDRRRR